MQYEQNAVGRSKEVEEKRTVEEMLDFQWDCSHKDQGE